jgi:hypothetical protein
LDTAIAAISSPPPPPPPLPPTLFAGAKDTLPGLHQALKTLYDENQRLKDKVIRLTDENEKLKAEISTLKQQ